MRSPREPAGPAEHGYPARGCRKVQTVDTPRVDTLFRLTWPASQPSAGRTVAGKAPSVPKMCAWALPGWQAIFTFFFVFFWISHFFPRQGNVSLLSSERKHTRLTRVSTSGDCCPPGTSAKVGASSRLGVRWAFLNQAAVDAWAPIILCYTGKCVAPPEASLPPPWVVTKEQVFRLCQMSPGKRVGGGGKQLRTGLSHWSR